MTQPKSKRLAVQQYVDDAVAGEATRAGTAEGAKVNTSTYTSGQATQDAALASEVTRATAAEAAAQAYAIQRANHTGTQAESTVTNLVADLAAKAAAVDLTAETTRATAAETALQNLTNTSFVTGLNNAFAPLVAGVYTPDAYGAKGDGQLARVASMTSGSATLTATDATFTNADVGKACVVVGAGAAGAVLKTTISAFTDTTHVTLAASASTTVSGTDATWGTDDTTAIQAAIDAAVAAKGRVQLSSRTYLFTHLTIGGNAAIVGTGAHPLFDTFANGQGNFTPLVAPFLTGCVLKCISNGQAEAILSTVESVHIDLRDFGLSWASPFVSTGHGIKIAPGSSKNGMSNATWSNLLCWGHDGDSYAWYHQNATMCTFTHLRAWGGGQFRFLQDGGSQYGNSTHVGCSGKLLAGGAAHATSITSTGSNFTRMGFIGCEWNAVPGRGYAALTRYAFTNPTAAQNIFNCPDGTLRGLSLISPAFDAATSAVVGPVLPHALASGGVFVDPGGWFTSAVATQIATQETAPSYGKNVVSMNQNSSATVSSALTLIATTLFPIRLCNATSAAFAVTLPDAAAASGRTFTIKKTDSSANAVTVTRAGSNTIDGATTYVLSTQYQFVTLLSDGSNWQVIAKG